MNWFHLKACVKCGGDLVLDEGDWRCLQCGSYYYVGLYREGQPMKWPHLRTNPYDGPVSTDRPGPDGPRMGSHRCVPLPFSSQH